MVPVNRKRLGLIFGGRSSEHEVSLNSARSVVKAIDSEKLEVMLICITLEGRWVAGENARLLLEGKSIEHSTDILLPHYPGSNHLFEKTVRGGVGNIRDLGKLDIVFPLLHGSYGEDGTIQGLFELAGVPYVGSGVAASAAGMDKIMMKDIFSARGLPVVEHIHFLRKDWDSLRENIFGMIDNKFQYPVFVKPANTGSSVGITKVFNADGIECAVKTAAEYDRKVIIERGIDVREIECSVLGNDTPIASVPGEIVPSREFYDYEAKYIDESSKLFIPADITERQKKAVQELSLKAFTALDCAGMARVDFFIERGTGIIYLNEVNTIPGFTHISMYPKLWEASGVSYADLILKLIDLAFERHADRRKSRTTYTPGK